MTAIAMKYMASNFAKLDKFEGVDFRRWQKNMHFLLSSMSVVYVLTTPIPEDGENSTMEQIRRRNKWDNDDYVCRGLILNGLAMGKYGGNIFTPFWKNACTSLKHYDEGGVLSVEVGILITSMERGPSGCRIVTTIIGNHVVGPLVVNMVRGITNSSGHGLFRG
ncbi:hypothetical protein Tco_0139492 [Tanacetum coccineum]